MKNRAEWLTFGVFVIAVLGALAFLLRRGIHGQSAALAIALLVILVLRVGIYAWKIRSALCLLLGLGGRWPTEALPGSVPTVIGDVRNGSCIESLSRTGHS